MTTSSKHNREDGTEDWRDQVKDAIIREVENGCPEEEASRRCGSNPPAHWRWRRNDRKYNNRIMAACKRSDRRVQRMIIASMQKGETYTRSCKLAGTQTGTVMIWRAGDKKFNDRVEKLMKKQRRKRDREKIRANKAKKAAQKAA